MDHTLFYKHSKDRKRVILIVYVDDIIIIGDDHVELEVLKRFLMSEFELKDLVALKYFSGIEVTRSNARIC